MKIAASSTANAAVPRLTAYDKLVQSILRQFEKIKKKKCKDQQQKCEYLINNIAHEMRKSSADDHLFHATAIWVLINLIRLYPDQTRQIMLTAGIPGTSS